MEDWLTPEELIDQLTSEAMAGRMVLLVGDDAETVSRRLGSVVEQLIDFGVELVRVDALHSHSAADVLADLADMMGIELEQIPLALKIRGQTGNPILLVMDNAECLGADARAALADLGRSSENGLGVVYGGERDAEAPLLSSGVPLALILEAATDVAVVDVDEELPCPRKQPGSRAQRGQMLRFVPWRHVGAVVGLTLLVWLFWPAGEVAPDVRILNLPETPREVVVEPREVPVTTAPSPDLSEAEAELVELEIVDPQVSESKPAPAPETATISAAVEPVTESASKPAVAAPAPPLAPPALSGMAAELGYRNEDWLLAQSGEQWVLQVAAAGSEDGARSLLDRMGRERAAYYRARRGDRLVFVVVAGPWASREQALSGRERLPADLRQQGPFPRQMGTVQGEIAAMR
ncbi:MAG: hypothetical protein CVV10_00570 [Gammaproteobacteria bacterium HGW-Gammaproteobacteria-14]|nr:MAG: hypothetical protein CVV10_00570 [Gammaproteobacteria bacterium HGW-Gammaproteobacteria-14]